MQVIPVKEEDINNFLKNYVHIPYNSGQNNKGIWIGNNDNCDELVKAVTNSTQKSLDANEINQKIQLFPKIKHIFQVEKVYYIVMEKLDGDVTSFFFDLIPNLVLENFETTKETKETIKKLFDVKTPRTTGKHFIIFHYVEKYFQDHLTDLKEELKDIEDISVEIYKTFMSNVIETIRLVYREIVCTIVKLKIELLKLGYRYSDDKFDNFGFKFVEKKEDDFTIEFYGKFIRFYILDWDSGLATVQEDREDEVNKILNSLQTLCAHYSVNGQYHLKKFNLPLISVYGLPLDDENTIQQIKEKLNISDNVFEILMLNYEFTMN